MNISLPSFSRFSQYGGLLAVILTAGTYQETYRQQRLRLQPVNLRPTGVISLSICPIDPFPLVISINKEHRDNGRGLLGMLLSTERFLSRKDKGKGIAADTEILIVSRITKDLETIPCGHSFVCY